MLRGTGRYRLVFSLTLVLFLALAAVCSAQDLISADFASNDASLATFYPPDAMGPYDVGVTTVFLTDEDRYELWGFRKRVLPLEIWYPSSGTGGAPNTIPDMVGELPDWGLPLIEEIWAEQFTDFWSIETSAYREADLLPGKKFPVILFSHGLTAIRFQNYTLCEQLASHGFVVVAPDHYGNAIFANIPDFGVIFFNPVSPVTTVFDRNKDVKFIYKELERMNADRMGALYDRLDLDKFGITGHSFGGVTSMLAGPLMPFTKAIAPINPGWLELNLPGFNEPILMVESVHDTILGAFKDWATTQFENARSTKKIHITLTNGGHYSATDACFLLPASLGFATTDCSPSRIAPALANDIVNSYITAFFMSTVVGDSQYDTYLTDNHFQNDIDYSIDWN
jgi:dienelactone hydrolase